MGLFDKLLGKGKGVNDAALDVIEETLDGIFNNGNFNLSFEISDDSDGNVFVELFGEDEENLTDKDGQLLDAFQLYLKRVLQNQLPEEKIHVQTDSNGYREEANKQLIELADKLKEIVLDKKKSVYFRALPPKDRKTIHQYLAEDDKVKSKSIGDGHFKKIKIFPADAEHKEGRGGGGGRGRGRNRNRNRNASGGGGGKGRGGNNKGRNRNRNRHQNNDSKKPDNHGNTEEGNKSNTDNLH